MDDTPFLPQLRGWLRRRTPALAGVRACTLGQLEERFAVVLPESLSPKAAKGANSRQRLYTPWRTFFCLLWQCLQPGASGREVVRQLQAALLLTGGPRISEEDGAYCRARARLPHSRLEQALRLSAEAVQRQAPAPPGPLQGRALKAVDGATTTLPDTEANRREYPAVHTKPPSFPLMRLVVLGALASGAVLAAATGSLHRSELALLASLAGCLAKGDIVVGDRGFGCYTLLAWLQGLGVDFIGRTTRRLDARRRLRRLGANDWLFQWERPTVPAAWLTASQWAGVSETLTVRVVRAKLGCRGFRVREVTVVTTLLDPALYPADEILETYLRRWRLEMTSDDLKTTLRLEMLRGHSPQSVQQELFAGLIAHNLVRWTMAQSARVHAVPLERLSFKGSLDALRHFCLAIASARSKSRRRQLWLALLRTLAADQVPERPGRRKPRAVKRKLNKYPHLSQPRTKFHDRLKRCRRRSLSRLKALRLK